MKTYSLNACEKIISAYVDHGGEAVTLDEGCLGLGTVVCYGDGLKTTIIQERYVNPNMSTHTIEMYDTELSDECRELLEKVAEIDELISSLYI